MKFMILLKMILAILAVVLVWLMVLPFAILALPYHLISNLLGIEEKGWESLKDFFAVPAMFFSKEDY